MDTKYTRTTITIPEDLLYEIKKKALTERKTVKEIVTKSLSTSLGYKKESGIGYLKHVRYNDEKSKLKRLANSVIGSVSLNNHPEWSSKKKVTDWVRKIRSEWE